MDSSGGSPLRRVISLVGAAFGSLAGTNSRAKTVKQPSVDAGSRERAVRGQGSAAQRARDQRDRGNDSDTEKADCQRFTFEFYPEAVGAWVAAAEVLGQYSEWCRAHAREQMPDERLLVLLQSIGWRPHEERGHPGFMHRRSKRARERALHRASPTETAKGRARVRALAVLDPRTDRSAAEAALADPRVSAALMDSGAEIPGWVVSPALRLDVTGMGAGQCARLLAHPAITTSGVEYIAERMNGTAASAFAARRDTPAGILDVLARRRSEEAILISIAGNPQRTTATLEALVVGTNARVVQAAVVGLLEMHPPSQVALIITALAPESLTLAIASLPTAAALSLATDPRSSVQILRALAEIHPDREVQTAVVSNGATTPELLAVIAKSGGSPEVRALVALDPRIDGTAAETALADPRVSAALMDGGAEIPVWVVSPILRLEVIGMGANQCIRLLTHPRVTPAVVLAEIARTRTAEQTLIAIARNSGSTPETLEALMQLGIASVSRAAATSPNAPPQLLRTWILSLDVGSRIRLAGESNLSTAMQRELSRDTAEQVRDCLLRNAQLDPAIATMMRRRPHLELPPTT